MTGKILLTGFDIEPAEKVIADNIIRNYERKISDRSDYEYIKLRLKKSEKGKKFLHEVEGELRLKNKRFTAKNADLNLFSVLADVLEKLLHEAEHSLRTRRQ